MWTPLYALRSLGWMRKIDRLARGSVEWLCSDDERGWPSGRASAFQADLHGFDSRTPLQALSGAVRRIWRGNGARAERETATIEYRAGIAQLVEHLICNQDVTSSTLVPGSTQACPTRF